MNTRPHCRTSPPIGIGGQPMPGGITTNSRTGFAASRPSAGFRIPSANCWISPGATMPEPIGSAAEPQTDDRRSARMGLVGDGRAAGVRNVAADYQALAPSAPSSCRSRARRFGAYLRQNALQNLDTRGQGIAVIVDCPAQQACERAGLFFGQVEGHTRHISRLTKAGRPARSAT